MFASILNSSVMLGHYLQQTTSADDIFGCIFLGALRVKYLHAGNCSCFCCRLLPYFNVCRNTIRVSNDLDQDQDRRSVGPDMGPNRLQILHCISRGQNVIRLAIMQGTQKTKYPLSI